MKTNTQFTNKDEYLTYRANWRIQYKQLTRDIRDLKFCRAFPHAKRFEDYAGKNVERYREIEKRLFNNPNTCVEWKLIQYRAKATAMLEERKASKIEAQRQYLAAMEQEMISA
jgi:hypothetical protein